MYNHMTNSSVNHSKMIESKVNDYSILRISEKSTPNIFQEK
jgi:hypothetical protein